MGKPSLPTPPDPTQVAAAQTQSNQDTARYQQQLNMIGQSGPGGSIGYEQVGTWADGTPRYQQTTSLSPEQQAIFNTNQQTQGNLANLAQEQSGRLGELLNQPLDWSSQQSYLNDLTAQNLNPQWDRMQENERARLAAQGITGGTAYNNAMDQFNRSRSGAFNDANLANFNSALSSQLALRNQGINEIIGLASGSQVQTPSFAGTPQTGVGGTDVAGIQQNAYNQQMSNYNAQQQQMGGLFGTIGNIAGAAMPFILSDERAKENIREIGETNDGQPIFEYNYKGSNQTQIGLMAQEVAKTKPESLVPFGGLMGVDYKSALRDA